MSEINPLNPVFPAAAAERGAPVLPAELQALSQAQRRAAMFAQLQTDPLFQAEFVDGFLREAEQQALAEVESSPTDDLARARDQWVNTKHLRQRLRDEMRGAAAALHRLQNPGSV